MFFSLMPMGLFWEWLQETGCPFVFSLKPLITLAGSWVWGGCLCLPVSPRARPPCKNECSHQGHSCRQSPMGAKGALSSLFSPIILCNLQYIILIVPSQGFLTSCLCYFFSTFYCSFILGHQLLYVEEFLLVSLEPSPSNLLNLLCVVVFEARGGGLE